jgi:hypothetical protein
MYGLLSIEYEKKEVVSSFRLSAQPSQSLILDNLRAVKYVYLSCHRRGSWDRI